MSRKKLSEMTPYERVARQMEGLSNEEAEEIAIKILSQIMAKHMVVTQDFADYSKGFYERLEKGVLEYIEQNSMALAIGRVDGNIDEE